MELLATIITLGRLSHALDRALDARISLILAESDVALTGLDDLYNRVKGAHIMAGVKGDEWCESARAHQKQVSWV